MTENRLEQPAVAWVAARLAEMDAAIASAQNQVTKLAPDAKTAAVSAVEGMQDARDSAEEAMRAALDQNRVAFSEMREALQPAWSAFEFAVDSWSSLSKSQFEIFSAQMQAQAEAWSAAFDQFRSAAGSAEADQRAALLDQIEKASVSLSQSQASVKALQESGWEELSKALKDVRDEAEKGSQQILGAFMRN